MNIKLRDGFQAGFCNHRKIDVRLWSLQEYGLPRRWIVERTFGWLMLYRRLVRDYENHGV